jgi:outer membrane receptor protein involved in Fe transport
VITAKLQASGFGLNIYSLPGSRNTKEGKMNIRAVEKCVSMPFWLYLATALLCLAPSTALSAEGVFTLGTVEVTGNVRKAATTVLTEKVSEEEMREFNRDDVAAALDLLPGVHLNKVGARNESAVYVRGFDLRHVPLFLDGIPIYVPYDGYPDLRRFTTFDLSQIVLSKGFASVLYGPNTMGGAINLVSKRPEKAFEGNMGAGFASGDSYQTYPQSGHQPGLVVPAGRRLLVRTRLLPPVGQFR